MYEDFYLKFDNESDFENLSIVSSSEFTIDIIGNIYKPTGEMISGEFDELIPVMEQAEGYHVNVRSSIGLPEHLQQYMIPNPVDPKRVWA